MHSGDKLRWSLKAEEGKLIRIVSQSSENYAAPKISITNTIEQVAIRMAVILGDR